MYTIYGRAWVEICVGVYDVDLVLDCVLKRLFLGLRLGRSGFARFAWLIIVDESLAVSFKRDKLGGRLELLVRVLNVPSLLAATILVQLRVLLRQGILLLLHRN